ncbi:MAG: C10 family peptidase [Bacteroidales bacterium]|nr:C10 family peptidase [Bacteroidales bacterium]
MKKLSLHILLMLSALGQAFSQVAEKVSEEMAFQTAKSFVDSETSFQNAELQLVSASDLFVYNIGNQGFVIISNNTVLPPVLGWSDQGTFPDLTLAPENVLSWLNHYSEMIAFAETNHLQPEASVLQEWDEIAQGRFAKSEKSVNPLVSTHWDQGCYYNEYCPATGGGWGGGPCGHALTGCVATAMAQVMKYWNHPAQGFGSHSYTHSTYGEQSVNFAATTYHWDDMPNEVWSQNDAVATLMYHCGVSVDMNYGASASGAYSTDVETALRSYFGYCGAKYRAKSSYTEEAWLDMIKAELDLSRPLYYSGNGNNSGHAFVCDGYDNNGLLHFNFGWSGGSDGYYSTYDLIGFNQNQAVVMNVYPIAIQADANGIIYVSSDGTGNGSSWENATDKLDYATALSSGSGTKVWVKAGTYYGDTANTEGAFNITAGNRIYGSFSGNEGPDYDLSQRDFIKNATVLDGQNARRVLNQAQVFNAATMPIWDGFTITHGAIGSGAGTYLNNYVTLNNCTIIDNHATMYAGGVYINSTGGTPRVTLNNCTITDNTASMGGGVCDRIGAAYTNCRISNNRASTKGGGIYLYINTEPTLKNCIVSNNTAANAGGIYSRGKLTAYNCNILMNLATESIGGVYHEKRHNKYYNCILWGNKANGQANQAEGESDYEYCAVQGGVDGIEIIDLPAENNGQEPGVFVRFNQYAQGAGADYHNEDWSLRPRSICLNAGKPNTTGLGSTDIAGNPRIQKGRVEIGAYESCASLTLIEDVLFESGLPYWFYSSPLTEPGYYTVVLEGQDCDSVIGLTLDIVLGMEEPQETAIQVWPNPTSGLLHIEAEGIDKVEICNLLGQVVLHAEKVDGIDLSNLRKGVYFLIASNKIGLKTVTKLIKE